MPIRVVATTRRGASPGSSSAGTPFRCGPAASAWPTLPGTRRQVVAPPPRAHRLDAVRRLERPDQHRRALARRAADDVDAPVDPVGAVDVEAAGRPEHHLVPRRQPGVAVRRRVVLPVRLGLDHHPADAVDEQRPADHVPGSAEDVARQVERQSGCQRRPLPVGDDPREAGDVRCGRPSRRRRPPRPAPRGASAGRAPGRCRSPGPSRGARRAPGGGRRPPGRAARRRCRARNGPPGVRARRAGRRPRPRCRRRPPRPGGRRRRRPRPAAGRGSSRRGSRSRTAAAASRGTIAIAPVNAGDSTSVIAAPQWSKSRCVSTSVSTSAVELPAAASAPVQVVHQSRPQPAEVARPGVDEHRPPLAAQQQRVAGHGLRAVERAFGAEHLRLQRQRADLQQGNVPAAGPHQTASITSRSAALT